MKNNKCWSVFAIFCLSAAGEERNPFTPPEMTVPCYFSTDAEKQWQLQGTLLQQNRQAARLVHPLKGHYLLWQGEYLPGTRWQVIQIDRRRVTLRNAPECLNSLWHLTMKAGYDNDR